MMKSNRITVLTGVAIALLMFSCGLVFGPAWKSDGTVVAIKVSGPALVAPINDALSGGGSSRAVTGGSGYLYLRLCGAPAAQRRLFGPMALAPGGTFQTDEIAAGAYPFVAVLYSAVPVENLVFNDPTQASHTVGEILAMDDAQFLYYAALPNFANAFSLAASGKILENVNVLENRTNSINAVLTPLTPYRFTYTVGAGWNTCALPIVSGDTQGIRRFFSVSGIDASIAGWGYVPFMYLSFISDDQANGGTVNKIAFFDSTGRSLPLLELIPGEFTFATPWSNVRVLYPGGDEVYFYAEYSAVSSVTVNLGFSD